MIVPLEGFAGPVVFYFNPWEIHDNVKANYNLMSPAGREQPFLLFGCGDVRHISLSVEIVSGDFGPLYVKTQIDALEALRYPSVKGQGVDRPPVCQLISGAHINRRVVVEYVQSRFGSHKGMTHHQTYLADPVTLLPRRVDARINLLEFT
jgi:hypothetical protein